MIENAGSVALRAPSETVIATFAYEPTLAAPGVPLNCPVDSLKLAQAGLLLIVKLSACPSGSDAVGRNEYA